MRPAGGAGRGPGSCGKPRVEQAIASNAASEKLSKPEDLDDATANPLAKNMVGLNNIESSL